MVRKKSECSPDDPPGTNGTLPEPTGNGTMTKADAVRACMAEAPEIPPADAVVWIKERFGVEMGPTVFSSYRSQIRRNEGGRNGSPRTRKASRGEAMLELLAAVRCVKEVVDPHGVSAVREVLALLAKYETEVVLEVLELITVLANDTAAAETNGAGAIMGAAARVTSVYSIPASRVAPVGMDEAQN